MTTSQPIILEKHGDFNAKSFKPIAAKIWSTFFDVASSPIDLMHWMVMDFRLQFGYRDELWTLMSTVLNVKQRNR